MKKFALVLCLVPMMATAADYRPLNFAGMDADESGTISRGEWRSWYYEDIKRRSFPAPDQAPSVSVETREGVRTLTPRAQPMVSGSSGQVQSEQTLRALRSQGLARGDEGLSPFEQRERLRQNGNRSGYIPTFEEFDLNGDGAVTRQEMVQITARPATPRY